MNGEAARARSAPSLDRSPKSPTAGEAERINALLEQINREDLPHWSEIEPAESGRRANADEAPDLILDEAPAGRWLRLTCENWRAITRDPGTGALFTPLDPKRAAWRGVVVVQGDGKPQPPRQSGDRWTASLSPAAKIKIENAALYSHRMGYGFQTFCSLTLAPEWRERLRDHDFADRFAEDRANLGAWASEFVNTLSIACKRGITLRAPVVGDYGPQRPDFLGRIKPIKGPLCYVWVAENPLNAAGESNPHIHLMFNVKVPHKLFRAWAAWIEKIWGKGWANLTKLKKSESAAAYMAKAARYLAKGAADGQGAIRGNRYGISASARPPAARRLGTYFADWIRDAITVMHKASRNAVGPVGPIIPPREKLKRAGLWAAPYAFGASTANAWADLWERLRRDGWHFQAAPPDLHAVKGTNSCARLLAKLGGYWSQYRAALFAAAADEVDLIRCQSWEVTQ